jgi:hypothetical protein
MFIITTVSTRTGRLIAELNLVVFSTNREKLPAQKTCDILNLSFQGVADDNCYIYGHLTSPKIL